MLNRILKWPIPGLTLFIVFAFTGAAYAQDDIIMLNNNVVKGKVEEVGVNVIKYHRADNMDGPIYDLPKGDVYMIVYASGASDVINPRQGGAPQTQSDDVPAPITQAPPEMPTYEQPYCPGDGYLWTPGYWAFGPGGYYWVPGVWVYPPRTGFLWTPGYWGFAGGYYGWHEGYWGEHIGYYGGVCYGYGYGGSGYYGGRWEGGVFRYNTAVTRVDVTVVHTTYVDNTVVHNNTVVNHSSFNGPGGVRAEPTASEKMAMNENHVKPTTEQQSHVMAAKNDKNQYVSANHGKPAVTAMNKPNGEHYSSEGHVTHTGNTSHSANETNTSHPVTNEQHSAPVESHPMQPAEQQHTSTPAIQQHSTTTNPKPAAKPACLRQKS